MIYVFSISLVDAIDCCGYEWYDLSMNALYALYFFIIACLGLVKSPGL